MHSFELFVLEEAWAEFDEGFNYYKTKSENLSVKFYNAVIQTLEDLESSPYFQVRYRLARIRMVKGFPYGVHYRINETENKILVHGIRFQKTNPETNQANEPKVVYNEPDCVISEADKKIVRERIKNAKPSDYKKWDDVKHTFRFGDKQK